MKFTLLLLAPLALASGWHHPPKPSSMSPSPSPSPTPSSSRPPPSSSVSPPSPSPRPPRPPRSFTIHLRGQNCCVNAKGTNICDEVELAGCTRASRFTWYGDRLQLVGVKDRCLAISREHRVIIAGCAPSNDPRIKSIAWNYNAHKGVLCSDWICLGTKTHWWRRDDELESRSLEVEELEARAEADAADAGSDPEGGDDLGVNGENSAVPGGEGEKPSGWGWPVRCPRLRTVWRRNAACFDFDYRIWW